MTFSIIIPTYNGSKYVAQAIESVLAQTRKPDEIIISDDNSSDNTVEICRKYVPYVKVVVNKNGPSGFVNGWNNAIAYATSDFISILHQDDLLAPDFLKEAEKALSENPDVKHFFVPCDYIDGNGKIIRTPDYCDGSTRRLTGREYVYEYRHKGEPKLHRCPGVITARSIFSQCKYREEAGHIADDDFFYRVGNFTDILGLYKPLAFYREHVGSETGHLMQSQLVRRLLHDMDFQYRNAHFNPLFDEKIKEEFKYWKNKYIIRLFVYSLKSFKIDDVRCALNYVNILDLVRYLSGYCRQFVSQLVKNLMGGGKLASNNLGKVLIVAPHPDDEVFGCGGLIARLVKMDNAPHVAILTSGEGSHRGCCSVAEMNIAKARKDLALRAARLLGVPEKNYSFIGLPDGSIPGEDDGSDEVNNLRELIKDLNPDTIFVPHSGEGWPDHINAAKLIRALVRELNMTPTLYEYAVWMWYYNVWNLNWKSTCGISLTDEEFKAKQDAIASYISAAAPCGYPWVGRLPQLFIELNSRKNEIFFKA